MLLKRILKPDTRLISVGDKNQAIYGFAGANAESYDKLKNLIDGTINLPLSICYRCGTDIVLEAQKVVSEIQPSPFQVKGNVTNGSLKDLKEGDWVLCRNVKPLVQLCLHLIKCGIKSKVKGKDIGVGLTLLINNIGSTSIFSLKSKLDKGYENLVENLSAKGVENPKDHPKAISYWQKMDIILFLATGMNDMKSLLKKIDTIFSDKVDGIVLSTIHKSKGLENDRIFFLLPELIPSRYATQPWQRQQERNLKFIAITRAKKELIYVYDNQWKVDLTELIQLN